MTVRRAILVLLLALLVVPVNGYLRLAPAPDAPVAVAIGDTALTLAAPVVIAPVAEIESPRALPGLYSCIPDIVLSGGLAERAATVRPVCHGLTPARPARTWQAGPPHGPPRFG